MVYSVNCRKQFPLFVDAPTELALFHSFTHLYPNSLVFSRTQAAEQVRLYCDKLLEEVDEAQAAALRQAENDVSFREGSLRSMREEVRVM